MKSCVVSAAEKAVDRGKRKHAEELQPLIEKKNEAHERLIATNSAEAKRDFRQQQRLVQKVVDRAREDWIR